MKDNSGHSEGGEVPKLTKEQATLILKIRDQLALNDVDGAYHCLYQIVSPNFDKTDSWEEIERIATGSVAAPKPDEWYTENEMYQWLITQKYSEEIAKELSTKWAADLQWSFNKGFKKGSDFITKSELAAAKESIKELLPLAETELGNTINVFDMERYETIISRAKALLEH